MSRSTAVRTTAAAIIAGAAGLSQGCAVSPNLSVDETAQLTRVTTDMKVPDFKFPEQPTFPATSTVTATDTTTVFSDPTQQAYFGRINAAVDQSERLAGLEDQIRILYLRNTTEQSRGLQGATGTQALLLKTLAADAATATHTLYATLSADDKFAKEIDVHLASLERIATATNTLEGERVKSRLQKFRDYTGNSGNTESTLNTAIAAKEAGADYGEQLRELLEIYNITQRANSYDATAAAEGVFKALKIDVTEIRESMKEAKYGYELQDATTEAREQIIDAYLRAALKNENTGVNRENWIAAMHYLTGIENEEAIAQGLHTKSDADRAEESMPPIASFLPGFGFASFRGPLTGRAYFALPLDQVNDIAVVGVYTRLIDPTFQGSEILWGDRIATIGSHVVYAAIAGYAGSEMMKGGSGNATGKSGGGTDPTDGIRGSGGSVGNVGDSFGGSQ